MAACSGYECNFVSEPDDALKCLICLAIARDPWQHGECGRLFCQNCLNKHGKGKPCPNCRMEQPQYLMDAKSKREIKALRVKCDCAKEGCGWEGTVGTLEEHIMNNCKVPCPNKCKEDNKVRMISRKDLDKHLTEQCVNRAYKCQYCGKKDTYANIMDIHDDICEKKSVPCPNPDCPDSMQRAEIKQHLENDCAHTVISCKYERIGCNMKMKRKDMGAHEQDDKAHFHQALNTIIKLQDNLQSAAENQKKESDDMAVKLRKESNNMAAELKRESKDMAAELKKYIAAELRRESKDMAAELKRESKDVAIKLRKEAKDMAVQFRRESGNMVVQLRRNGSILLFIGILLLSFFYFYNNKENTSLKKDSILGFRDCCQVKELVPTANSGSYEIVNVCNVFQVGNLARCDMETAGGEWLVIQRRINGSVNFYRNWTDYVSGFGDLEGEFWYGLEKIHCLTTRENVELCIELGNGPKLSIVWTYQLFKVGGAETNYRLTIGQGQGVGGTYDAMAHSNGASFSTPDRDNDNHGGNCAVEREGAWWHNACSLAHLNSKPNYTNPYSHWYNGSRWIKFTKIQMKIRPKRCSTCK